MEQFLKVLFFGVLSDYCVLPKILFFSICDETIFMPELPEVESFRRYLEDTSMGKPIIEVEVKREKILHEISIDELVAKLICRRFLKTLRWGKLLFIQTDGGVWLTVHFGMTGLLFFFHQLTQEPKHCRLLIKFCDNNYLCFDDQRLFGRIGIVQNIDSFVKKHHLGPDVLTLNKDKFVNIILNKKTAIKNVLMKQELFAGNRLYGTAQLGAKDRESMAGECTYSSSPLIKKKVFIPD